VRAGVGVATVCVTRGTPPFSSEPHDRQKRLESGTFFAQVRQVTSIPLVSKSSALTASFGRGSETL
jgi:hypothetical protein